MDTHTCLCPTALLVACRVCCNLLQRRQRIFLAEPCCTSSTGLLCKHSSLALISSSFSTCIWLPSNLSLSVKSSLSFPASLSHSPRPFRHYHYHHLVNYKHATHRGGQEKMAMMVGGDNWGNLQIGCFDCSPGGRHRALLNPAVVSLSSSPQCLHCARSHG